jgi:hypothetical protein
MLQDHKWTLFIPQTILKFVGWNGVRQVWAQCKIYFGSSKRTPEMEMYIEHKLWIKVKNVW